MGRSLTFLLVFISSLLHAQKEDYTWIAGEPAVKMDFTDSGFTLDTSFKQESGTAFFNTSFTMNDGSGNLLFYTNGASVFDRNGKVMQNGNGLNPSAYLNGLVADGEGNGFLQGAVGVQKPGSDSIYYLFHFTANDNCPGPPNSGYVCVLYMTTINMKDNNGLGEVIEKNRVLLQDQILTGCELTLAKHGNDKDWWLIKQAAFYNRYYKFLITSDGITGPFIQDIGAFPGRDNGELGTATISPDGTRFAGIAGFSKVNIFDFDRCTSEFYNPDSIAVNNRHFIDDSVSVGTSLAFSPDSRFLYVSSVTKINQYDLNASNIQASEFNLITLADSSSGYFQWLQMQLAPDGKIYIRPYDGFNYLSVINYPDSPRLACGFAPWSVPLPCAGSGHYPCAYWGLPQFPQYRLPKLPVYLAVAGADKETCKDTLVQIGNTPQATQLVYYWSSNDPNAYISDIHSNRPVVSTRLDSAQFYLWVTDTVSKHGCVVRGDTVNVRTNLCTTGILQTDNLISIKTFPYLYIYDITPHTSLTVYNLLGQLIYTNNNYQNDWDVRKVANAVYLFQIKTSTGQSYNGKLISVH